MRLKIFYLAVIAFLLSSYLAFARVDITASRDAYNLGDSISVDASILRDSDLYGLLNLELVCASYSLQFFLTPVSIEKNFRTTIQVPEFKAVEQMIGECSVHGSLSDDNNITESSNSREFQVSNKFSIKPSSELIEALPGSSLALSGYVANAFGDSVSDALLKVSFEEDSIESKVSDGEYDVAVKVPPSISSGRHEARLLVLDQNKNNAEASVFIDVIAVPTTLGVDISGQNLAPGEALSLYPVMLDQHGDELNETVSIEVKSPDRKNILRKESQSNKWFDYETSQYSMPGTYTVTASHDNLQSSSSFNISRKREIKITYHNESVRVENTGNVIYEDQIELKLVGKQTQTIKRKVKVYPGESIDIDLSSEVGSGIYDIFVEGVANSSFITSNFNLSSGSYVVSTKEQISDHRPIYKKIKGGLGGITASVIGADGILTKNPVIAPIVLSIIVLLVVFHYAKGKISGLFSRRRKRE